MPIKNVTSDPKAFLANTYHVVIVGGGTAGLALAARLSENPNLCIGVIEAGEDKSHDPILTSGGGWPITSSDPQYHWGFSSVDQANLMDGNGKRGKVLVLPRGKLLGGCSAINALTWMRASKPEYDALETVFGNSGWNFDSLLPYFRKSQAHTPQPSPLFTESKVLPDQGTDGPVKTSYNWWYSSLIPPFVKALQALFFTINPNPDSGNNTGISNIAHNIDPKTSRRQDSVISYLKATENQSNIYVLTGAHACNILFEDGSGDLIASGVTFQCANTRYTVKASKEVVLSAGAYQTPQLLELSGIGNNEILKKFGIKQRLELPVGENLQDHLMVYLATKLKDEKVLKETQTGSLAPLLPSGFVVECVGSDNQEKDTLRAATMNVTGSPFLATHIENMFADSQKDEGMSSLLKIFDDIAVNAVTPLAKAQYKLLKEWLENPQENTAEALLMFACVPGSAGMPLPDGGLSMWLPMAHFHPTSRGSVHISSTDPLSLPSVDLQCMNDYDFQVFRHLVRFGERVMRTEPLASLAVVEPPLTEDQLEEFVRKTASVVFHPVGTAAMASRELGGVVDSNLVVYGTQNLRVVDASVIPLQLGAMPQATIYAIAEKAADIMQTALKA